jgi:hypothetical protein
MITRDISTQEIYILEMEWQWQPDALPAPAAPDQVRTQQHRLLPVNSLVRDLIPLAVV